MRNYIIYLDSKHGLPSDCEKRVSWRSFQLTKVRYNYGVIQMLIYLNIFKSIKQKVDDLVLYVC